MPRPFEGTGLFILVKATSQGQAGLTLATARGVKYPAALQRCKFDAPLLAAGLLTFLKHPSLPYSGRLKADAVNSFPFAIAGFSMRTRK